MAFPQTPLDVHVELKIPTWTQIQGSPTGVRGADNIVISRGHADEQQTGSQQPSTCTMSLNDRDGRYNNRNPLSPYYGLIGRNTPIRVSTIGDGTTYTRLPGTYGADNISTPDNAALHITGDIDIRVDATLDNWLQYQTLAGRWAYGGTGNSWILYLGPGGDLRFAWSTDGTDALGTTHTQLSHLDPGSYLTLAPGTRQAVRVTLAVATGVVTFYKADTISGSWTALTTAYAVGPVAAALFAGSEPLIVAESGQGRSPNSSICAGKINAVQVLSGIAGTAKANPDFTALSVGTTSFNDAAGRTWTLNGDTEVTNRRYRFHGEVSSFPQKWDISGADVWVPIEAAGILRRYQQGSALVSSPIRRAVITDTTQPIIYWPCEDAAGTASFAVGAGSGNPMLISGSPTLATDTHIGGSGALPTLGSSIWTGTVPTYTAPSTNASRVAFVVYLPTAPATGSIIMRVVSGTTRFDFGWSTSSGGGFYVNAYDTGTGSLAAPGTDFSASPISASTGTAYEIQLWFTQSGSAVKWGFQSYDGTSNGNSSNANLTSRTLGKMTSIVVDPGAALSDTVVGHIAAYASDGSLGFAPPQGASLTGNTGETAGNRFVRICLESGIQPRTVGNPSDSPAMGAQGADTLINILQSCVDADGGIMAEPRDVLGLLLVMRSALMSQSSAATLSISSHQLSAVPEPVDDDQLVRNTITVTRTGGSYATATLITGALSVNDPPNGVGVYQDSPTINFQSDAQLLDEASWRMHAGTIDESRWPVVTTGMHTNEMVANPTLAQQVQALDIGQVQTLTGMPSWLAPDDTRQLIQGITETMSNYEFTIGFNCSPASAYDVVILDDATFSRLDADGSTTHASFNSSAVSFQVDTASGSALWSTSDTSYDVVMAGDRMTATAVSSASSPQTFTVTRGIAKAHSSGETVQLFRPFYLGL